MSTQKKQWGAIIVMIALFAMIAFVTNLCSPMAIIVKNDFGASNVLAQIGNYGNFIAYLVMGIPAGMLIAKFGYKKTALIGLFVGICGILIQWLSGHVGKESAFLVYLIGAFVSGFTMCILNCVVNPMLNLLGGGGNKGNQYIQIGGVFNSTAAVCVYIIMGALIGDAAKAHIADATPALMIALAIFVVAFIIISFTKIEEPEQAPVNVGLIKGACSYRHFVLGIIAIFLYMGIEVGVPTYVMQYLSSDTEQTKSEKIAILSDYENNKISAKDAAFKYCNTTVDVNKELASKEPSDVESMTKMLKETEEKISKKEISVEKTNKYVTGIGMSAGIVGLLVAVYWFMMLVGRLVGASISGKVSSRVLITTVSLACIALVLFGIFAPADCLVSIPGVDWANLNLIWAEVPVGIFAFILVGLCTSVMWGGIFNMAVEGLGKYTAIASGIFMTMVFGCAVMLAIEAGVADAFGSFTASYWVILGCAAYILFYALIGSRPSKKALQNKD